MLKFLIFIIFTGSVYASDFSDLKKERVKNYFINEAAVVLKELSTVQEIFKISNVEIDLKNLRASLEKVSIEVTKEELVDNTGSIVDVIGEPNFLKLHLDTWINFQKQNYDLRPLIIHELLRISSINDDDYLISRPLYSQLTSTNKDEGGQTPYCNLRVSKTKTSTSKKKFSGVGFEPMNTRGGVMIFNSNRQNKSFENAVADVKEKCEKAGYYGFEYISGQTRMERRNTNGFIKMETKTSIKAYCFKDKVKKRKKKDIRKETCKKINSCEQIYKAAPSGQVDLESYNSLKSQKKENKCAS
ncbi:MAG: hypothetical protein CME70_17255 [Halobacteriovorax sp.]|nr:hypothetical protein [Halobacteriovorax sp.]|tara:strand:- start:87506 stop:88408 length:903 start_codon:yes stop_codon:yes gene_type:complete